MKSKKSKAVVNFTIHSLRLPEDIQDPFQIEFKRGSTTGITEKKFVDNDNEVPFEKNFRCCVTLIRADDKSLTDEFRKKKIAFTVFRYRDTSKKVFGKFTVNAADYVKQRTDTFEVESPHSKKSFVIMTLNITQTQHGRSDGRGGQFDSSLDSQSEAIQLTTDRQDEWDVSDMVTPESKERIQSFFMKREAEKNEQRSRLADFQLISSRETRSQKIRTARRKSMDLLTMQAASSSSSSQQNAPENAAVQRLTSTPVPKPAKLDSFLAKKAPSKKRAIPLPPSSPPDPASRHDKEEEADAEKKDPVEAQREANLRFLRSVMAKFWDELPLNLSQFPRTAAAVAAAFIHARVLERSSVSPDSLIEEFVERYKSAVMISNFTEPLEKWYVTFAVMATVSKLKEELGFDEEKTDLLINGLHEILVEQFNDVLNDAFGPFKQIGQSLVEGTFDELKVSKTLNDSVHIFQDSIKIAEKEGGKKIINFFTEKMIEYFDKFLLKTIIESPTRCSFQSAVQWNTVITVLSDFEVLKLPLFRQAASVLMMSMALCGDPGCKNDICPDLDEKEVLKLLTVQIVDEFLSSPNDPTMFMEHFGLVPGQCEPELNLKFKGNFDQIKDTLEINEWKNIKFSPEVLEAFPYLKNFFSSI